MSISPEPPERLAQLLREILALSNSAGTSQSESERGDHPGESFDAHGVEQQPQRKEENQVISNG